MTDDEGWSYAGSRTVLGAVQRGLGRAVFRVAREPGATDMVLRCVVRDHRWDWQVDERAVYLARLVRQMEVPVTVLLSLLDEHPVDNGERTATRGTWCRRPHRRTSAITKTPSSIMTAHGSRLGG